jgi:beta-galactosidase
MPILHGGDYNPEQWPETVWDEDVRLMQLAHVNVATLPVFGWVSLQPDENTFTFDWLDRIIEKLTGGGVSLCLATATASTPAWLDEKYPDILRVDSSGHRLKHGNRHSFCPNSPNFKRAGGDLVHAIADRYAQHPKLALWHVGNEYGNTCYCDQCAVAFRIWLSDRYDSLEKVNERWYTKFWGHTYTSWEQIEPPTTNGESSMQSLLIDYNRFQSDSLLSCYTNERDILRRYDPNIPITTNLMGTFKPLDYHKWAQQMDIVAWDSYPSRGAQPAEIAFSHSLMRGLKEGQSWLLMEQTPSQQNWQPYNSLKRPGVLRLWSFQAIAHGSDAVMYFQWRRSRGACEKYHGAVVEHAARTDARVFQEVAALGAELEGLGDKTLLGRVATKIALLFDWDNWWGVEFSVGPSIDLKYLSELITYYSALHRLGYVADVVSPEADIAQYSVVIAPLLYMVKPGIAEKLTTFVENGGTFVTTYFSGIVDETDIVYEGGYPGPLRDLLGIWVEETDVLSPTQENAVRFTGDEFLPGARYNSGILCDRIHTERGAAPLAVYTSDFYAGEPAITVNTVGLGRAYYIGTHINDEGLEAILATIALNAGVRPPLVATPHPDIETVERVNPDGSKLTYILNHSERSNNIALAVNQKFKNILTGELVHEAILLGPHGVAVLKASG